MAYYHKYKFVSPESIYTEVKEELRSYFDTGMIDDTLFPIYIEDCLKRLGRSTYKISENILRLDNFQARLPEDFEAVRELWICSSFDRSYVMPNAHYEQIAFKVSSDSVRDRCDNLCAPECVKVTYKTTNSVVQSFNIHTLLRPGNSFVNNNCSADCINKSSDSLDTFDIRDNKIITSFREGTLYLVYYKIERDDNEDQMIPDNIRIKDYLKAYLKYKCFEMIYNQVTDETYRQIEAKYLRYEQASHEAYINASVEMKKQTIDQVVHSIKRMKNRFRSYNID